MKLVKFAAAAVLAASSLAANASLLQISGGTTVDIPSPKNDFESNFPTNQTYTVGGNLLTTSSGTYKITYSLIGYEASYFNSFYINGDNTAVINNTNSKSTILTTTQTLGKNEALNFTFSTVQGNASINNGSNAPLGLGIYNFAVALDTIYTTKKNDHDSGVTQTGHVTKYYTYKGDGLEYAFDAVLFLDDIKGFNTPDDDNHDDLIIGINIVKVPEPSALLLMGLGLLGLAGARRLKA